VLSLPRGRHKGERLLLAMVRLVDRVKVGKRKPELFSAPAFQAYKFPVTAFSSEPPSS